MWHCVLKALTLALLYRIKGTAAIPTNASSSTGIALNNSLHERAGPPVSAAQLTLNFFMNGEGGSGAYYYTQMTVGANPPTTYTVIPDTGSGNTWLGAGEPEYPIVDDSMLTGQIGTLGFSGAGVKVIGPENTDVISLVCQVGANNVNVQSNPQRQSIIAADAKNLNVNLLPLLDLNEDLNGLMGLAPSASTRGTFSPDGNKIVPNLVQTLFAGGALAMNQFDFYVTPSPTGDPSRMILGGTLQQENGMPVQTRPPVMVPVPPGSVYWTVGASLVSNVQAVVPGGLPPVNVPGANPPNCQILPVPPANMPPSPGFVDSGVGFIRVTQAVFDRYQACIPTGMVYVGANGDWLIDRANVPNLPTLRFGIGGQTFDFSPDAQVFPNANPGEDDFVLAIQPQAVPDGYSFILGTPFFQRFYIIHDMANSQLGFAPTKYTANTYNQA